MAELSNRDELEKKLARKLGKFGKLWLAKLLEELGDFESLTSAAQAYQKIPPVFWDNLGKEMVVVLAPFLEDIYLKQAQAVLASIPIGVEWSLVNQNAIDWASSYSFELVKGINDTSRRELQKAFMAFFERGETVGDLEKRITGIFGPVRAQMIATTEITRASATGKLEVADRLKAEGIEMRKVWLTDNDELVCPICLPLHEKEENVWRPVAPTGPPAHVNCRCDLALLLPKVENA